MAYLTLLYISPISPKPLTVPTRPLRQYVSSTGYVDSLNTLILFRIVSGLSSDLPEETALFFNKYFLI